MNYIIDYSLKVYYPEIMIVIVVVIVVVVVVQRQRQVFHGSISGWEVVCPVFILDIYIVVVCIETTISGLSIV